MTLTVSSELIGSQGRAVGTSEIRVVSGSFAASPKPAAGLWTLGAPCRAHKPQVQLIGSLHQSALLALPLPIHRHEQAGLPFLIGHEAQAHHPRFRVTVARPINRFQNPQGLANQFQSERGRHEQFAASNGEILRQFGPVRVGLQKDVDGRGSQSLPPQLLPSPCCVRGNRLPQILQILHGLTERTRDADVLSGRLQGFQRQAGDALQFQRHPFNDNAEPLVQERTLSPRQFRCRADICGRRETRAYFRTHQNHQHTKAGVRRRSEHLKLAASGLFKNVHEKSSGLFRMAWRGVPAKRQNTGQQGTGSPPPPDRAPELPA
jgi:hypothetical protein